MNKLRDRLGRRVRQVWINWAKKQPNPKPSWLLSYDELPKEQQEVDQCIGMAIWGDCIAYYQDYLAQSILDRME